MAAESGYIHNLAVIGGPPEDKSWEPGRPGRDPEIDPTARVEAFVSVDAGVLNPTRVGARSWLLKHVHAGHDVQIGQDVVVATGTVIGGYAEIEDGAHIGVNATILPYRTVGEGAKVGAGAVVTRDVDPYSVVAGNPARVMGGQNPIPYSERHTAWSKDGQPLVSSHDLPRIGDRPATIEEVKGYIKQHG